jgi:hypothetical protein
MVFLLKDKNSRQIIGEELIASFRLLVIVANISSLVFFTLELFKTGLISNTVDLNLIIAINLISLLIIIIFGQRWQRRLARKRWLFPGVSLSLLVGLAVLMVSHSFGLIGVLIAVMTTALAYIVWYSYVYKL